MVKIASYNVENLFDLKKNGNEYQEYIPNTISNWNEKTYKIKLQNLSKVIKDINADIIALQEIETLKALKDLRYSLQRQGLYYPYYKIADRKNTTTKVAVLSKFPFEYARELLVTSSYRYRNILELKYKINNKELYVFINHWKSKSGSESQRIISAKTLRKRINSIGYDKNIILLGDFNSDYEENIRFIKKRKHNDTGGKTGINHVLKTKHQQKDKSKINVLKDKEKIYNLWYDANIDERWSYIFKGKKEALDNILVTHSLLKEEGIKYKRDSIHTFKPNYIYNGKKIYRWKTTWKKPRKHKGKGYSDHLAVIAEFVVH